MKKLKEVIQKLINRFLNCRDRGEVHYINGYEILPAPLQKDEEREIFERIEAGDESAREPLIVHNLRLVVYIARKFENSGVGIEDLISIGTIGLIKHYYFLIVKIVNDTTILYKITAQNCSLNLSKFNTIAVMFDLRVNTTYIHNLAILVFRFHITCAIYCFRIMVV